MLPFTKQINQVACPVTESIPAAPPTSTGVTVQRHSPKQSAQSGIARSPITFFWTVQLAPLFSSSVKGSRTTENFLKVGREHPLLFQFLQQ